MAKPYVLILSRDVDPHTDDVVVRLKKRNVPIIRFHTADFPAKAKVTVRLTRLINEVDLLIDGNKEKGLDEIISIWNRRPDPPKPPASVPAQSQSFAAKESDATLQSVFRSLDKFWVNHPDKNLAASHKLPQLLTAAEYGLLIPDTLVTNDPKAFTNFYNLHGGKIVTKTHRQGSINSERELTPYTSRVTKKDIQYAALVGNCPILLQAEIPKEFELRVTVIGSRVFAARLDSQSVVGAEVDWRKAAPGAIPTTPYTLPGSVEYKIRHLMGRFGLVYGAFDFVVTPDGRHIFLEINPNGQFGWLNDDKTMPLYDTMADLLAAGKP